MIRKGIFGGTFDPIHNGHLYIARKALEKLNLDYIIFMPSGNPPHKTNKKKTEANIRYNLVNAAIKGEKKFLVSDFEINNKGLSYTYKTLQYFTNLEPNTEWYFVSGADCLIELDNWKNVDEILSLCKLSVFNRPVYSKESILMQKKRVEKKYNKKIIFLDITPLNISSTEIKERIKEGKSVKHLLPENVYNMILQLKLYQGVNKFMWSEDKIIDYLKNNLSKERYEHSLRVKDIAIELAQTYNIDIEKSKFAALIHDCAKNMSFGEIIDTVKKESYDIDDVSMKSPSIMHGLAASIIAKNLMGVQDENILNAVAYHTTGRKNMSILEKIIYIADYIEPMRNFEGVEELRRLAYKDLDEALLLSFNNTIKYVISRGQLIHKDTIEARNYMLMKRM